LGTDRLTKGFDSDSLKPFVLIRMSNMGNYRRLVRSGSRRFLYKMNKEIAKVTKAINKLVTKALVVMSVHH
jgi:hypothetical protein